MTNFLFLLYYLIHEIIINTCLPASYPSNNDVQQREADTTQFMQVASWLGLIPGADGQILQSQEDGNSPIVSLFKSATAATVSTNPINPTPFYTMSKQAEAAGSLYYLVLIKVICKSINFWNQLICQFLVVADLLYKANLNTGSVLEYALAFTSAALDKFCTKWSAAPKTGFIDITTSKDFYRIFSGLQIVSESCFITTAVFMLIALIVGLNYYHFIACLSSSRITYVVTKL